MFDIGWTEILVVGVVMILVVGPKDLPGMLRSFGKTVRGLRRMAGDFQRQFDDALREADLDDVKKISQSSVLKPLEDARNSIQSAQKQVTDTLNEPIESKSGTNSNKDPAVTTKAAEPEVKKPEPAKQASVAAAAPPMLPAKPGKATKSARPKTEKPRSPAKTAVRRKTGGAATGSDA